MHFNKHIVCRGLAWSWGALTQHASASHPRGMARSYHAASFTWAGRWAATIADGWRGAKPCSRRHSPTSTPARSRRRASVTVLVEGMGKRADHETGGRFRRAGRPRSRAPRARQGRARRRRRRRAARRAAEGPVVGGARAHEELGTAAAGGAVTTQI